MSGFAEYDQYDGLGLAELVRQGKVTAAELCEEAVRRIEERNPRLNAVVTKLYDQARQAVSMSKDGIFAGVPFLLKDLHFAYAGAPATDGCRALKNHIATRDSEMVARFKKTGLVILGKTNTPEFGLMGVTEPELFGPCRNPWNIDHTPGGSSGGSASAVAAGITPLAAGGDGGGSIRIPSSCCGLFGLKPSRGRSPLGPDFGQVWQGAVQNHVITRSVRDSAAVLDAVHGPDVGAPYEIRPPARPYIEEVAVEPGELAIGYTTRSPIGTTVHPECIRAVQEAAKLLESLGHRVEEAEPEIDGQGLAQSYMALYFGEVAADIDHLGQLIGRKVRPGDVEDLTWTLGLLGKSYSSGSFVTALRRWDQAARRMGQFFQKYDLYLTPTTAYPPARIGELKPKPSEATLMKVVNALHAGWLLKASGLVDQMAVRSLERTPFTQLANLTGLPAMSVPLHWTEDGLPCGSQFIAPFGEEALLFRLAAQLEKAKPWFDHRPPA